MLHMISSKIHDYLTTAKFCMCEAMFLYSAGLIIYTFDKSKVNN